MVVMHAPASYSCTDALKACLESRWALASFYLFSLKHTFCVLQIYIDE